jgi:2',3'-cyclic-nucleotide 2'-phosphodiesterase (5'-nucleotidase family)
MEWTHIGINGARGLVLGALALLAISGCSSAGKTSGSESTSPSAGLSTDTTTAFTLLYQGGRSAVTEPCGCHSTPYGGTDREWNAIKATREENPLTLYVDAGNSLGPEKRTAPIEVYRKKALALVDMLNVATLEVLAPGPQDLALGVDFLKTAQGKAKFPFVNTSILSPNGTPLFSPTHIVTRGSLRVGILGISPARKGKDWVSEEPQKALNRGLEQLKGKVDWVVVLSQLPGRELEVLAEKNPSVQIFVGSDPRLSLETPFNISKGKSLILDSHVYGYKLGRLETVVKLPFTGFFSPHEIMASNDELAHWKKQVEEKKRVTEAKMNIERLEKRTLLAPIPEGTQYANTLIGLSVENYGKPNEITEMLKKYQTSLKQEALNQ